MRYKLLGASKENNHLYLKVEKKRKVLDILENLLTGLGFSRKFSAAFVKWNFFINDFGGKAVHFSLLQNNLDYNKINPILKKYFIFEDKK